MNEPVYSSFVGGEGGSKTLNPYQAAFERWLTEETYVPAEDLLTYDSKEGGFFGGHNALDLVDDFLQASGLVETISDEDLETLKSHAAEMGSLGRMNEWGDPNHEESDGDGAETLV